jgi:hypothetical protein
LYSDIAARKVVPGAFEYKPDYALWSDGADKRRWIILPEGTKIDTSDMAHWVFPLGTKFFKEFSRDGKQLETRLVERVKQTGFLKNDYFMGTFIWRADQSDAILTAEGRDNVLGTEHDVPRQKDCIVCHQGEPGGVLGFSAVQLSASGTLRKVERKGWLSDKPGRTFELPGDAVQKRALGVMHANCGHCHAEMAMADFMHLRFLPEEADRRVEELDAYRTTVGVELSDEWEDHPEQFTTRVVPGDPNASAIVYRMATRGDDELVPDQMPPLATRKVDDKGLAAVRKWIESLAGVEIDAGTGDAGEGDAGEHDAATADAGPNDAGGAPAADGGGAGKSSAGSGGAPSAGAGAAGAGTNGGPIGPGEDNPPVLQPSAAGAGGGPGVAGTGGSAGMDVDASLGGAGSGASGEAAAGSGGAGAGAAGSSGASGGATAGSGVAGDGSAGAIGAAGSGVAGDGSAGAIGAAGSGVAGGGGAGVSGAAAAGSGAAGGGGAGVSGAPAAGSGAAGATAGSGGESGGSGAAGTAPGNGGAAGSDDSDVPVDEAAEHDARANEQTAESAGLDLGESDIENLRLSAPRASDRGISAAAARGEPAMDVPADHGTSADQAVHHEAAEHAPHAGEGAHGHG